MKTSLSFALHLSGMILATTLMSSTAAWAQFSSDGNEPVQLFADNLESEKNIILLNGQVDVRQGNVRILADNMKVFGDTQSALQGGAIKDVERIVAKGNFYYITPNQEVRGDQGIYEQASETFIIMGNVILLQDENNIITGEKLVYSLRTNNAHIVGTCKGRRCGTKGRVKALLQNQSESAKDISSKETHSGQTDSGNAGA